jgi:ATP-dependent protease ClpP protease subunit
MYKWLKNVAVTAILALSLLVSSHSNAQETIELTGRNTALLDFEIMPAGVHGFLQAIVGARTMLPLNQTLYIVINSPGGVIEGALLLRKVIDGVPNVALICDECDSGAGLIFVTSKQPRLVTDKSTVMCHEMSQMVTAASLTPQATASLKTASDAFNKEIYTVMGMSKEQYEKNIIGQQWEIIGAANVKLHLADRVVKVHCDPYMRQIANNLCDSN